MSGSAYIERMERIDRTKKLMDSLKTIDELKEFLLLFMAEVVGSITADLVALEERIEELEKNA